MTFKRFEPDLKRSGDEMLSDLLKHQELMIMKGNKLIAFIKKIAYSYSYERETTIKEAKELLKEIGYVP